MTLSELLADIGRRLNQAKILYRAVNRLMVVPYPR